MKRILVLALLLLGLSALNACTETSGSAPTAEVDAHTPAVTPASVESEGDREEALDDTTCAIRQIISGVSRDAHNFVTEHDFYAALSEILSLYELKMTPCADDNAYFFFDYDNIASVRLLTQAESAQQVAADIAMATEAFENHAEAYDAGNLDEAKNDGITKVSVFEKDNDVLNSSDLVVSFVVSATSAQEDQALFYTVCSAALAILDPNYADDRQAFDDLKEHVFTRYAGRTDDVDAISWIDGLTTEGSFTIPGNAIECWFGTTPEDTLYLALTPYAVYEDLIDVAVYAAGK